MRTKNYNKKGNQKTKKRKNKNKKTKKQRGGFICQEPKVIQRQSSYFNKSEDLRVNTENYFRYLDECETYSKCVFTNINNLDLIKKILTILNTNIGNTPITFTYKKIPNTEKINFKDYKNIERNLNNQTINENVSLNTSKFLDIYLTKLYLEYYLSYYSTNCETNPDNCYANKVPLNNILLTDSNTTFLDDESQKFIIDNGIQKVKNKIINFFINLDNKFILQSILQILSNTFTIVFEDRVLIKDAIVTELQPLINKGTLTINNFNVSVAQMVIEFILQIFIFNFAKFLKNAEELRDKENSVIILKLIYKIVYSIVKSKIGSNEIKFLIENRIPKQFTIGIETKNIKNLPIFTIVDNINIINCITKTFLEEEERLNTLCSELEEHLTLGTPFNKLATPTYLVAGCKTNIGLGAVTSYSLITFALSYIFS